MPKTHFERLARWKEKHIQDNKAQFRVDIDRIVAMIDRNMYGFSTAKPKRQRGATATRRSDGEE